MLRILLPTDFSPPALNAFRYATNLATLINGRIDLVHVHLPEMLGGSMLSLKDIKDTERGVRNRFLERLESFSGQTDKKISKAVKHHIRFLKNGDLRVNPRKGIAPFSGKNHP